MTLRAHSNSIYYCNWCLNGFIIAAYTTSGTYSLGALYRRRQRRWQPHLFGVRLQARVHDFFICFFICYSASPQTRDYVSRVGVSFLRRSFLFVVIHCTSSGGCGASPLDTLARRTATVAKEIRSRLQSLSHVIDFY